MALIHSSRLEGIMGIDESALMQSVYDTIYKFIAGGDASKFRSESILKSGSPAFLTLAHVGTGIKTGMTSDRAKIVLNQKANVVPALSTVFVDNGKKLKNTYQIALYSAIPVPPSTELPYQFKLGKQLYETKDPPTIIPLPDDWYEGLEYETVTVNTQDLYIDKNSFWGKIEGSGKLDLGFFAARASGEVDFKYYKLSKSSQKMVLKFDVAVIELDREWYLGEMFEAKNWKAPDTAKDAYSTGKLDNSNKGSYPLYPAQIVVIRNFSCSAEWAKEDEERILAMLKVSTEVKLGPFTIKGSLEGGYTKEEFTSSYNLTTVATPKDVPFFQGYLCSVIPASPPAS
jgi:hypothetical protein